MNIAKEKELPNRVADFISNWHTNGNPNALETATVDDFASLKLEAHIAAEEADKSFKQWVQSGRRADHPGGYGEFSQKEQSRETNPASIKQDK